MSSKGDPICFSFVLIPAGLGAFWYGLGQYYLKKTIEYTPTSKAAAVAPGIAEVTGVARPFKEPLVSPYGREPCAYYSTALFKWAGSGKHRNRFLVNRWESPNPIYVEDETGRVLVQPAIRVKGNEAAAVIKTDLKAEEILDKRGFLGKILGQQQQVNDPNDKVFAFVSANYPSLSNYDDKLDVEETYIKDGDPLYVIGTASVYDPDETEPRMIIRDDPSRKIFCMADGSEKDALSTTGAYIYYVMGGPILVLLGVLVALARLGLMSILTLVLALFVPLAMYLWMAGVWLLAVYNGLIVLRNGVDRAQANIDALSKKRSDLIPSLVDIVKGYAKYEKALNQAVTEIRASSYEEGSGKALLAIGEDYPKLQANENFMKLQAELSRVENELAGSRTYLNESVLLYNSQIAKMPYLIIAMAIGLKPLAYNQKMQKDGEGDA